MKKDKICPNCKGNGVIRKKKIDYTGTIVKCPKCKGTGISNHE